MLSQFSRLCFIILLHARVTHLSLHLAFLLTAKVSEDLETRTPAFQLHLPVQHHTRGDDDEVRAPVACMHKVNGQTIIE